MQQTKPHRLKKFLCGILLAVLAAALLLGGAMFALWHNEIGTIAGMQLLRERDDTHQDGAVYTMHVKGKFYLDDFVAQGGVKNDTELIHFVTSHITKGLIPLSISDPEIGCSSFAARSESGDMLFARNYDFSKTNTCIVTTDAGKGRHASISTVDLQFLGMDVDRDVDSLLDKATCLAAAYAPLDGINDAGVACGIYMTYQGGTQTVPTDQNTEKPDLTSTTLLRLILDYADTVDDAVEIAESYDLHDSAKTSYHYMVADASGKSAILEWVAGTDTTDNDGSLRELKVIYHDAAETANGTDSYQVITNFVLQDGYYNDSPAEEKKGADRYEEIDRQLRACGGVVKDEAAAMDILSAVGRRSWKNDDGNGCTVHSAVYNLTDKTATWVPNEHYGDPDAVYTFHF